MLSYFVLFSVDTRPVKEFEEGDSQCKYESTNQNVKDSSHVTQRQLVLRRFLLVRIGALATVVPPFVSQPSQIVAFFQRQNGQVQLLPVTIKTATQFAPPIWRMITIYVYWLPQRWTERGGHSESLGVKISSNFHRVARITLVDVVIFGTLDEQSVFTLGLTHSPDAFVISADKDVFSRIHKLPHSAVNGELGILHRRVE